ncbi:MAG: formyltransferase family protein [bacterium]
MKIVFYGGRQAGMTALLTLLAAGEKVVCVIPVDEPVINTAKLFKLNVKKPKDINDAKFVKYLFSLKPDLFVCCHGRQILKKEILKISAINLHPCLYKYKGSRPIARLLQDNEKKASVGVHWMAEEVDQGKVIAEEFIEVKGVTQAEVYNELYPVYAKALIAALKKVKKTKV